MKKVIKLRNKTKIIFKGTKKEVNDLYHWFWANLHKIIKI